MAGTNHTQPIIRPPFCHLSCPKQRCWKGPSTAPLLVPSSGTDEAGLRWRRRKRRMDPRRDHSRNLLFLFFEALNQTASLWGYLYGYLTTPPISHVSGSSVPGMTASLRLIAGAHRAVPGTEQRLSHQHWTEAHMLSDTNIPIPWGPGGGTHGGMAGGSHTRGFTDSHKAMVPSWGDCASYRTPGSDRRHVWLSP